MKTHTQNEYFIMKRNALKKSIKTLKKMISFYKENPCILNMSDYDHCAFGHWLKNSEHEILCFYNVSSRFKEHFKIKGIKDLVDIILQELEKEHRIIERDVVQLFCTYNVKKWSGKIASSVWIKEAKKVIKSLEFELKNFD